MLMEEQKNHNIRPKLYMTHIDDFDTKSEDKLENISRKIYWKIHSQYYIIVEEIMLHIDGE